MRKSALRLQLSFASVAVVMFVAGPAQALDWGTPGLDGAHSRFTNERSGPLFGGRRWSVPPLGGVRALASPVVADGFVVVVDLDGVVRALRADTGRLVWQVVLKMAVQGTPAVQRGRVYVPTLENQLVALRLLDGAILWTHQLDGMVMSSPVAIDDDIVLAAGFPQRHVERLSSATGKSVWRSMPIMEEFSNTSPAVGDGLVLVGSNGGRYYALDAVTGLLKWEYDADGIVNLAAPLIVGSRVYMAGGGSSSLVHAVDLATGAPLAGWPVSLPSPAPDIAGTIVSRQRAVSSIASAAGLLILETRLDDSLDTDGDGTADEFLSREVVLGLNASTGAQVWQYAVKRVEPPNANYVPSFFVCPTPAGYLSDRRAALLAVASSLDASVRVLDAATGLELARNSVAGPALASPVVANGMLLATAFSGTTEGLTSSANHAPTAPIPTDSPRPLDAADPPTLRWLPGRDPDGEPVSYELRIDSDGEVVQSWDQRILLGPGVTSTTLGSRLTPGLTYTYALRARDERGALSPWSPTATFALVVNPAVTVNGASASSLASAMTVAQPGDLIGLGAGTYMLAQMLSVRAGVRVQGAGAGRTTLDATGLATAVNFEGPGASLDAATVTGADTCINVADGASGVKVSHTIVRDCRTTGVVVRAGGAAQVVNVTVVSNPTGVSANGVTQIKNSLLAKNGVALSSGTSGALASTFNDLFGNQTNYSGLVAGTGDVSEPVTFVDFSGHNLLLPKPQASTDRGDPADQVGTEPSPNGGRINLGAFGGTAEAETSSPSVALMTPAPNGTSTPVQDGRANTPAAAETQNGGGCAIGGRVGDGGWSLALAPLAALVRRRRHGA